MQVLLAVILVIAVAVGTVLLLASRKPDTMEVRRSKVIAATPEQLFALINDFRQWSRWSPWEELDPTMQRSYSGATTGVGAVYEWQGNKKVGKGRMEITKSTAPSEVVIDLHFMAPWEAKNVTVFTLTPTSDGTEVCWTMTGKSALMFKVMGLFVNMDTMLGNDFEKGLTALARAAQAA